MKKFFPLVNRSFSVGLILFLILSSTSLFAQNTFQKTLNGTTATQSIQSNVLPNGNIVSLIDDYSGTYSFTELNPSGQFIQSFSLTIPNTAGGVCGLSVAPNGQLDMITYTYDMNFVGIYTVTRFTTAGTVLFSKNLEMSSDSSMAPYFAPNINYFSNGDLAVCMSNYSNVTIVRMNTGGNLIWTRILTADTAEPKDPSFTPCMTADGGMMIPGKRGSDNFFVKLDGNGNVQWSKLFDAQGLFYTQPRSVIQTASGDYIVGGLMEDYALFTTSGFLMKLDANGSIVWLKNYTDPLAYRFPINEVVELNTGELVMAAFDDFTSTDAYILVADANGILTKTKKIIQPSASYIFSLDLCAISNTDILVSYVSLSQTSVYSNVVMRSEGTTMYWCDLGDVNITNVNVVYNPQFSAGMFTIGNSINNSTFVTTVTTSPISGVSNLCAGTGITETPDFQLSLSPNPATTHLNIDLGDSFKEGMSYQIIDVLGKVHASGILSQPVILSSSKGSILDIQFLSSGLYILEVQGIGGSVSKRFIKG